MEYSRTEIRSVLSMIDGGNKPKKGNVYAGLSKNISAFGIAGLSFGLSHSIFILLVKHGVQVNFIRHVQYIIGNIQIGGHALVFKRKA